MGPLTPDTCQMTCLESDSRTPKNGENNKCLLGKIHLTLSIRDIEHNLSCNMKLEMWAAKRNQNHYELPALCTP